MELDDDEGFEAAMVMAAQGVEETEGISEENNKGKQSKHCASDWDKYFEYKIIDKVKYGCCLLCGKSKTGKHLKIMKMTDCNTSGLKAHLMRKHPQEYKEFMKNRAASAGEKSESSDARKKPLNKFFENVSIYCMVNELF